MSRLALVVYAGMLLLPGRGPVAQETAPAKAAPAVSTPKLSGYLQARETWQEGVGLTGSLNRARLAASGTVSGGFSWRIMGEFRTGNAGRGASVSLQDAYVRWTRDAFAIQVGQYKTPFTREFVTSLADIESADRSTVVDSLAPKRDIGLMGEYSVGKRAMLSAGVFNGNGQNVTTNPDSTVLGVARLVLRPIPMIGLGANVARYFGDSTRYGADISYEGPQVTLRGEYVAQSRDQTGGDHDEGWFVLGAAQLVPQVQLFGKYEYFERPAIGPQQENRAWTGGANLFLSGKAVRLTLEYVSRRIGDPGTRKGLVLTQLQLRF